MDDSIQYVRLPQVPAMPTADIEDQIGPVAVDQSSDENRSRTVYDSSEPTTNKPATTDPEEALKKAPNSTRRLRRSFSSLFLVTGYAILALFSWIVLCILNYRPLGASSYTFDYDARPWPITQESYSRSEDWYKASRVIQSIVSVLTMPLTTAICAKAAVVYAQYSKTRTHLTMRQTMILADKGWADFDVWMNLLRRRHSRYASPFLYIAIILTALGFAIAPLQQLFLSQSSYKSPTAVSLMDGLTDISDLMPRSYASQDDNYVTALTRGALSSTSLVDTQSRLWQSQAKSCRGVLEDTPQQGSSDPNLSFCTAGDANLGNITLLGDPFFAQLSSNFSTGVVRQYLPRINSTAEYRAITPSEFPPNCEQIPGSFYFHSANESFGESGTGYAYWSVTACIPSDQRTSPWRNTRMRQETSEELFMNISLYDWGDMLDGNNNNITALYKMTLNTTFGYFELPNYMNGQRAQPLLQQDPIELCGIDCIPQWYEANSTIETKRSTTDSYEFADTSLNLETIINRPPLLTIAMALFGDGSYISERLAHPDAFIYGDNDTSPYNTNPSTDESQKFFQECIGLVPWVPLVNYPGSLASPYETAVSDPCARHISGYDSFQVHIAYYLLSFTPYSVGVERLENAFTAAAFLANEAWMGSADGTSLLYFDLGQDTTAPHISKTGIILLSILLSIYLLGLFAVATYASLMPRWTSQLDSFAMMRLGAVIHTHIPLDHSDDDDKISILDNTPGWIGDLKEMASPSGELGIGGLHQLECKRLYRAYA